MLLSQVYVNSFLALLNARYYVQSNIGDIDSSRFNSSSMSRSIHRPEPYTRGSQDISRMSMLIHPDGELYPARPVRAVMVSGCAIVDEIVLNYKL